MRREWPRGVFGLEEEKRRPPLAAAAADDADEARASPVCGEQQRDSP